MIIIIIIIIIIIMIIIIITDLITFHEWLFKVIMNKNILIKI